MKKVAIVAPERRHRRRSLHRHLFVCREEEDDPSFPYRIRGVILFNGYHQTRETDPRSAKGFSLTDLVTDSLETQYAEERIREPLQKLNGPCLKPNKALKRNKKKNGPLPIV